MKPKFYDICSNCDIGVGSKQVASHKKNVLLTKIIFVAIVITLSALFVSGCKSNVGGGSGGYRSVLNKYFKAYEEADAELMCSTIAQYWIDYRNAAWGETALESVQDDLEDDIEDLDCGEIKKITYEVNGERRATDEELKELEDNIYNWYAYYVYEREDFSITDAYVLDISFTVEGEDGTVDMYYPDGFLMIKENGKWKTTRGRIECSFYER